MKILMRHGEDEREEGGGNEGNGSELSTTGKAQVEGAAMRIKNILLAKADKIREVVILYSSKRRTQQTAELLKGVLQDTFPVKKEPNSLFDYDNTDDITRKTVEEFNEKKCPDQEDKAFIIVTHRNVLWHFIYVSLGLLRRAKLQKGEPGGEFEEPTDHAHGQFTDVYGNPIDEKTGEPITKRK